MRSWEIEWGCIEEEYDNTCSEEKGGEMATLYGESCFHAGNIESDGIEVHNVKIGNEHNDVMNREIEKRGKGSMDADIPKPWATRMREMLRKYHCTCKLKFGSRGPVNMKPIKMRLMKGTSECR